MANELNNPQFTNHSNISLSEDQIVEDSEIYVLADQLIRSFILPFVMKALIDLGVLQLIHDQAGSSGLSPVEIAALISAKNLDAPVMLDRMLRLAAANSVISCKAIPTTDGGVERRYMSAPVTKWFVPDENGVSFAPMLNLSIDKVQLDVWGGLKEAVLEGEIPFNKVHGMPVFEYSLADPRYNAVFNKAMNNISTHTMKSIVEGYKGFKSIQRLVDVGGGFGHNIRAIASKFPSIKCINFDLPHVIEHAPEYSGVEHIGGNMFDYVPNGDGIFMKWILHNWNDENCLKLLQNCYKALPENGRVIVVETVIKEEPETTIWEKAISQLDLTMLTTSKGGKERTAKEYESLAIGAGFQVVKFDCCASSFSIIEFGK